MNIEELINKGTGNTFYVYPDMFTRKEWCDLHVSLIKDCKEKYKEIKEKDNQIQHLQNLIDKTTNYYLKTLAKNGSMPDEAVEMFNLLEGNK